MSRWLILMAVFLASPIGAFAHGLSGQCLAHGNQVTVQAYFDTDEPAIGATIRVLNSQGTEVTSGKTDDTGAWTFPNPGVGKYRIVIEEGAQHRAELSLDLTDTNYEHETRTSRGPGRAAFTGFKLGKIAAGVFVVIILAVGLRLILRRFKRPSSSPVQ